MIFPVIMAGGTGTRFWPQSRSRFPKQFLKFNNDESLLQATYRRIRAFMPSEQIFVVTNKRYLTRVSANIPTLPVENIIVEPMRRDTAPCIGLAALFLSRKDSDAVMVMIPSDHFIAQETKFLDSLQQGIELASNSKTVVTLGITPTEPKTGYGYIKKGEIFNNSNDSLSYFAEEFTEKPNKERAQHYLNTGKYYWNSGVYICQANVILAAIEQHLPKLARGLERISKKLGTSEQDAEIRKCYRDMDKISIDYGVMEKVSKMLVVPCECGWDDIGSWSVIGGMFPQDEYGNSVRGHHIGIDTAHCIIEGCNNKLVATLGVENLIVVQTKDVVMICNRERDQEVKNLVKLVKSPELRRFW